MNRLFGTKKAAPPAPQLSEVHDKVENRAEAMNTKIAMLDKELLECKAKLAQTRPGPAQSGIKARALQLLRQKKMFEQQRNQLMAQGFNMGQVRFAQENAKFAQEAVSAMKQGAVDLKAGMKNMKLGQVEDLQDDLADLLQDSEDIQDVLSRPYGLPNDVDEGELEAELAGLEEELLMSEAPSAAGPSYLRPAQASAPPAEDPYAQALPEVPSRLPMPSR